MDVILLEKIERLGDLGDRVKVRPGHARNYLLPRGKAVQATAENIAHFEERRAKLEARNKELHEAALTRAEAIGKLEAVTISCQVSPSKKLFGSIGPSEIAEAATAAGAALEKSELLMSQGRLRTLGDHPIRARLHSDVEVTLIVRLIEEQ